MNRSMYTRLQQPVHNIDGAVINAARARQAVLTKPLGALGELEAVVIRLAGMQATVLPRAENVQITVFAADHGIATAGVSAYPQEVTAQMVMNFARGGAAVSVVAKHLGACFEVVNLGTVAPVPEDGAVISRVIAPGTRDFSQYDAMDRSQLQRALEVGFERVDTCCNNNETPDLFIAGEMGIGNTSSATALAAVLLGLPVTQLVGPGTGLDSGQMDKKAQLIQQALSYHQIDAGDPLRLLQALGGFEIAAMTGAYLGAAQRGIPILVDGFISTVAALLAIEINPKTQDWFIYGHCSAEPAHRVLLEHLKATPLLQLGMRLGEGSGAAIAVDLLRSACRLHEEMATFAEAGVSDKDSCAV